VESIAVVALQILWVAAVRDRDDGPKGPLQNHNRSPHFVAPPPTGKLKVELALHQKPSARALAAKQIQSAVENFKYFGARVDWKGMHHAVGTITTKRWDPSRGVALKFASRRLGSKPINHPIELDPDFWPAKRWSRLPVIRNRIMPAQHQAGIPTIIDRIEWAREGAPSQANEAPQAEARYHDKPGDQGAAIDECPSGHAKHVGLGEGVNVHVRVVVPSRGFLPQIRHSGSRGMRMR